MAQEIAIWVNLVAMVSVLNFSMMLVQEGDFVPLFEERSARVYETPGHHPSCLTFEIGDCLFTGDAYIPGEKVITNLPGGNKGLAAESVKRIVELGERKMIWSGHARRQEQHIYVNNNFFIQ